MRDTIIFLSAFTSSSSKSSNWVIQKLRHIFCICKRKHVKLQSLLQKYHISSVSTDHAVIFGNSKMGVVSHHDYIHQKTTFSFNSIASAKEDGNTTPNNEYSGFYMGLKHAQFTLLDDSYFKIDFTFLFDPFIVRVDNHTYQVDAGAFIMNNVVFIAFELINYETGISLSKDDIYGKSNNFNIIPIEKYRFAENEYIHTSNKKISEIVYDTISDFMYELTGARFLSKEPVFFHNTLVLSNNIKNISKYICKLLSIKEPVSTIKDISTVDIYKYYPQDGCCVISNYEADDFDVILYSAIILESVKLYLYIFPFANLEDTADIQKTVKNYIYLQNLFCSPHLPIITQNLFEYVKESPSYIRHMEALRLKISYLSIQNDLRKNRNSTILNVLLYIISLVGAIGALEIIEERFHFSFRFGLIIVIILFILGGIWGILEYRNNRQL